MSYTHVTALKMTAWACEVPNLLCNFPLKTQQTPVIFAVLKGNHILALYFPGGKNHEHPRIHHQSGFVTQ